jgi:hypothetical protein
MYITGSLIVHSLPTEFDESLLILAFEQIASIEGSLYITENAELITLRCFSSLIDASVVYISGNNGLVDARLPMLSASVEVIVRSNRRLCLDNYPRGMGNCSLIDVRTVLAASSLNIDEFTAEEQTRFSDVLAPVVNADKDDIYIDRVTLDTLGRLQVTVAISSSLEDVSDLLEVIFILVSDIFFIHLSD